MPTYRRGRHEHGQNYLADPEIIAKMTRLVEQTSGPIIEIGPGQGALTQKLQRLDRRLTAVEIDPTNFDYLREGLSPGVKLINADFLRWRLPAASHVVVGNVPFSLTTAILRKLLHTPNWTHAVLLVQWEVARRRAGVGGASMMTAQWWPWIEFSVKHRVPRSAFRPAPNVDGGLLVMQRRPRPLIHHKDQVAYRQFVHAVFTGKGNGIAAILTRLIEQQKRHAAKGWLAHEGIEPSVLPKNLCAEQWAGLFNAARQNGWTPETSKRPQQRTKR